MFIKCKVVSGTEGNKYNRKLNKDSFIGALTNYQTMCQVYSRHTKSNEVKLLSSRGPRSCRR